MAGVITWFEIPALDVERATRFYSSIIGATFERDPLDADHAFFGHDGEGVGGEVCREQHLRPGAEGVVVYLNAPDGIAETLARVPAAGGTVVLPKTEIGPHGFIAHILDTEGNRIGLHSLHG
jgi:hypothetical protein